MISVHPHFTSELFCPTTHLVQDFDCGVESLNRWLVRSAALESAKRVANTFVWVLPDSGEVIAYYALCGHSLARSDVPSRIGRGMADPLPAALIAKLAMSREYQGFGLGKQLLRDALERIVKASLAGLAVRAIVVDAIDGDAANFYRKYGFRSAPNASARLLLAFNDALEATGDR